MPIYVYKNEETGDFYEVLQKMTDDHVFFDPDTGVECKRVFTVPNASVDSFSNINPFDIKEATQKTAGFKGSVGDLWDISKDLSQKREDKLGHEDPQKRKVFNEYQKKRGVKHFYDKQSVRRVGGIASVDYNAPTPNVKLDKGGNTKD